MRYALFVFFLVLLILFIPIKLKGKLIYNVFKNEGHVSLFFFNIKLFLASISFKAFKLIVKTKKKESAIPLTNMQKKEGFGDYFFSEILDKVKINDIRNFTRFGIIQDCMVSCMGSGMIIILSSLINTFLYNKKTISNSLVQVFPDYTNSRFLNCITSSITINLFVIIWALVVSFIKFLKKEGN